MIIILSYIIGFLIAILAVAPALPYQIPIFVSAQCTYPLAATGEFAFNWLYVVIVAGVLGMYLLSRKLALSLKALAVYLLISCFYSVAPAISFNHYLLVIITIYLFLAVKKCDKRVLLNFIQAVFWFEVILAGMQMLGRDVLLDFGNTSGRDLGNPNSCFLGTIMQYMRFSSLLAVMAPLLILKNRWYIIPVIALCVISQSSSFAVSIGIGLLVYFMLRPNRYKATIIGLILMGIIGYGIYDHASWQIACNVGRLPRWLDIIRVFSPRWISGWGLGTFQPFFPVLLGDPNPFPLAHNDFLQFWCEMGLAGLGLFLVYCANLIKRLYNDNKHLLIAGLACIGVNMFFAFPACMTQTILVMVMYVGLCEKSLRGEL